MAKFYAKENRFEYVHFLRSYFAEKSKKSYQFYGAIPFWRYDTFLDYAAEAGILRKVGGGYIFRHRMLLEYFAEQYE